MSGGPDIACGAPSPRRALRIAQAIACWDAHDAEGGTVGGGRVRDRLCRILAEALDLRDVSVPRLRLKTQQGAGETYSGLGEWAWRHDDRLSVPAHAAPDSRPEQRERPRLIPLTEAHPFFGGGL